MKVTLKSGLIVKSLILISLLFVQASYAGSENSLDSLEEQSFLDDMWDELTHTPSEPWGRRLVPARKDQRPRKKKAKSKRAQSPARTSPQSKKPVSSLKKKKIIIIPQEKKKASPLPVEAPKRKKPVAVPQVKKKKTKLSAQPSIVAPQRKVVEVPQKEMSMSLKVKGKVQSVSILDNEESLTRYCSLEKVEGQRRLSLRLSEKTGGKRRFHIKKLITITDEVNQLTAFAEKMKKKEDMQLELKNVSMAGLKMSSDLYYRARGCALTGSASSGEFKLSCTEGLNVVDGEKVSDIEIRFQCEIGVEQ